MSPNENRRCDGVATGGEYHSKYLNKRRIGLQLAQRNSPTATWTRRALKRAIVRFAMAGALSPQLATRLITHLRLVSL
jgi:hypothetical protein